MKTISALILTCLLIASPAFAAEPNEADQKWLQVVEKKMAEGKTEFSTPSEERVKLVEELAKKKGYTAKVTKTDSGYRVEFSKSVAKN